MWRSCLSGWFGDAHATKNRRNAGGCLQRQLSTLDLSPLLEQLSREPLRSWQIEGFGDSRLRMLESHGLSNGEQLRANIDRLCSLPGFGPGREDLVLLPELLTLQNGEQQLQALGRAMATFAAAIETLQPTICDRRSAMEAQLKAFEVLC
jgi:hypothetical protein